ncbi:MAG: hypothetical protein Q4Q04_05945, partial [Methanocorpusculum sp.]|nr:hypothetical protein [Methanocorpusculum sp.]
ADIWAKPAGTQGSVWAEFNSAEWNMAANPNFRLPVPKPFTDTTVSDAHHLKPASSPDDDGGGSFPTLLPAGGYVPIVSGGGTGGEISVGIISSAGTAGTPIVTPLANPKAADEIIENLKESEGITPLAGFEINGAEIPAGQTADICFKLSLNPGQKAENLGMLHGLPNGASERLPMKITKVSGNDVEGYGTTTSFSPFVLIYEEEPAQTQSPAGMLGIMLGLAGAVIGLRRKQ